MRSIAFRPSFSCGVLVANLLLHESLLLAIEGWSLKFAISCAGLHKSLAFNGPSGLSSALNGQALCQARRVEVALKHIRKTNIATLPIKR